MQEITRLVTVSMPSTFAVLAIARILSAVSDALYVYFFFSSRRRHTRFDCDWSSDVCSSDLGSLLRDHLLEELDREGLHVHGVRGVGIRLNRRGIAVHEDDPDPFFAERSAGLGTGVVELRGLADHDGAGADHHGGLNVLALGHRPTPSSRPTPP